MYLLSVSDTTGSFLTMTAGKLVSYLRYFSGADSDLTESVSIIVNGDHDLINNTVFTSSHEHTGISLAISIIHQLTITDRKGTINVTVIHHT